MPASEKTFQIHLEGLIKLLAQNLYTDPDVFLREMIQNAHDSIRIRRETARRHASAEPLPPPRIEVTACLDERAIDISDNGSGLTEKEIDDYLSTIGRSGTMELRKHIERGDRGRTVELIGQFGIGLLSAFIVSERVVILTKSSGHEGLRWESHGGATYSVNPSARSEVGTTVRLYLHPQHTRYLQKTKLHSIVRRYADFISVPVYLDDDAVPANIVNAPWHKDYLTPADRDQEYAGFWRQRFPEENPLHVLSIDELIEQADGAAHNGRPVGNLRGVLAITDRNVSDANGRGTVDVYVNRMFVSSGNRDVLPTWAGFFQGVIECDVLTPNAARDNIMRDGALAAVQQSIGRLIVRALVDLSLSDNRRFVDIMRRHSYSVLAMSVQPGHEDFLRAVADLVPLATNESPMSMADYLTDAETRADGSHVVHYVVEPGSANQFLMLAAARGITVFDCTEPFAERFLQRYAQIWPGRVHLSRLDSAGAGPIFGQLSLAETKYFDQIRVAYSFLFSDGDCVAKVSRFRPVEVPAVLTETRDSQDRAAVRAIIRNDGTPEKIRKIARQIVMESSRPSTLHLNADNISVQKLAARGDLRDPVSQNILISLFNNAALLLNRSPSVEDIRAMSERHNETIELLLSQATERAKLEQAVQSYRAELDEARSGTGSSILTPFVSCFVAMPFHDSRADEIFDALREVLELAPFYWKLVRADESVEEPGLWDNVKAKLIRSHCYIAILTGEINNPNVMIEIGRMEALQRPILLLHDAAASDLPADLHGLLYAELQASGAELVAEVRDAVVRREALRALHGERHLSEATLRRQVGLAAEPSREISRRFPTWREFLDADADAIAGLVGLPPQLIETTKTILGESQ